MREIKFRGWYDEGKEWIYAGKHDNKLSFPMTVDTPTRLTLDDNNSYENKIWKLDDNEITWSQYTGIKDKNGKEIYEGDIIKSVSELIKIATGKRTGKFATKIAVVKWVEYRAGFRYIDSKTKSESLAFDKSHIAKFFEVIGNIYENPELLE